MNRKIRFAAAALAAVVTLGTVAGNTVYAADSVSITNVSYDPTRELYEQYNKIFQEHWKEKTGQDVDITQSHGGSGKQALEVANGLEADVVTLALEYDVDAIQNAGLIDDGWIDEFPDDSSPYTSTIVFLVRKGNPKGIKDFIKKLYQNVLVLDSGARGATTSFVENGQGDVLIAWENEAYLSVKDYPDDYEIITPSISILAQPSVAVVDTVVDEKGTRDVATEYLNYLYSDEAQRIAGDNYYRPSNEDILKEYSDVFDLDINLVTIDDFGGWKEAQETHFSDGGVFDQIYEG